MMKDLIPQFSFFEFLGILTSATILGNYLLDQPLINITVFILYCFFAAGLASLNFYLSYKSNSKIKNEF